MKSIRAACAAILVASASAHATDTFHFTVDGQAWEFTDVAACEADPDACTQVTTPLHQTWDYTVAGDGDWSFHLGGLSVRGGQVTDFYQDLGDCDVFADDWSSWHDCSHGQLIDESGAAYGYYTVYAQLPGFVVSGWFGNLSVTSDVSAVPEPAPAGLLLAGGAVLLWHRRQRQPRI